MVQSTYFDMSVIHNPNHVCYTLPKSWLLCLTHSQIVVLIVTIDLNVHAVQKYRLANTITDMAISHQYQY